MKRGLSCLILLTGVLIGGAQSSFDAASIKPNRSMDPRAIGGGGCRGADNATFMAGGPIPVPMGACHYVRINLTRLLASAYPGIRISGAPGWADSEFYDIDAKAANTATVTKAELIEMLHQFLADRFQLKLHRETREVPGYSLVLSRTGSKLIPVATGAPQKDFIFGTGQLSGRATTAGIAAMLSNLMRSIPITDDTGLTGEYDYTLTWTPDKNLETWYPTSEIPDESAPSLFTALQDQLGLRLVSKRNVKVDVLVVDSVEKPSLN